MRKQWHQEIFTLLDKVIKLQTPFEFIHFPGIGMHSALRRYASLSQADAEFPVKCFYIDLRTAQFNTDSVNNRNEFNHVIRSYIQLYAESEFMEHESDNLFRTLEILFKQYFQQAKSVLIAFDTAAQTNLKNIPEFRNFIVFLDQMRFLYKGNLHYLISTSVPLFDANNPAPVTILSEYFNFYKPGPIYRFLNEEILNEQFKTHTSKDTLKLLEISGGLISIAVNLVRDFIMQDKKLKDLEEFVINAEFFNNFINSKAHLDRIRLQLEPRFKRTLWQIAMQDNFANLDLNALGYLRQTGILDEKDQIRGLIFKEYAKLYFVDDAAVQIKPQIAQNKQDLQNTNEIIQINTDFQINSKSGDIFKQGRKHDKYLTETELRVFLLLHENINQSVNRESIGKAIWNNTVAENYSDWAIDKTISRIRDKLEDFKPYRIIRTERNAGFRLVV